MASFATTEIDSPSTQNVWAQRIASTLVSRTLSEDSNRRDIKNNGIKTQDVVYEGLDSSGSSMVLYLIIAILVVVLVLVFLNARKGKFPCQCYA